MRDAAGELAHRFHLLRLAVLRLELFALRLVGEMPTKPLSAPRIVVERTLGHVNVAHKSHRGACAAFRSW